MELDFARQYLRKNNICVTDDVKSAAQVKWRLTKYKYKYLSCWDEKKGDEHYGQKNFLSLSLHLFFFSLSLSIYPSNLCLSVSLSLSLCHSSSLFLCATQSLTHSLSLTLSLPFSLSLSYISLTHICTHSHKHTHMHTHKPWTRASLNEFRAVFFSTQNMFLLQINSKACLLLRDVSFLQMKTSEGIISSCLIIIGRGSLNSDFTQTRTTHTNKNERKPTHT